MIRLIISSCILSLCFTSLVAQTIDSLNYGPEPLGGISKLALEYYKIDFTPEQRQKLAGIELELIYSVDTDGNAFLEDVNGLNDLVIFDSLKAKTPPKFYPQTTDGIKEHSIYLMKLTFPKYSSEQRFHYHGGFSARYKQPAIEDFEYIHKSGTRIDMLFGGVVNSFGGSAYKHLATGGGMKIDVTYTGASGFGGGLVINFYFNELKKEYPISATREQNASIGTVLVGAVANKFVYSAKRHEFNFQLELCLASQNVSSKLNNSDKDNIQFTGFSPAIAGNYLMKFGKGKPIHYYGEPSIVNHYVNLHAAIRPLFFNEKAASGVMFELGLSYRMGVHMVDQYRLKPEFFMEK
jgi:hypothetical protein